MCGRFNLRTSAAQLAELFEMMGLPSLAPRYNIAPSQPVLAIRLSPQSREREATHFQWGLVPSWSKDPTIGNRMINARSETVATKPSFRSPFKRRRCLIPTDGFYEWQKTGRAKQPFHILMKDERPFSFAGLWEHWESPDGSELETCTILTTSANELLQPIHDRMPVILNQNDYATWLDHEIEQADDLESLLVPYPSEEMQTYPISTWVNKPAHDDPRCIESMPQPGSLF